MNKSKMFVKFKKCFSDVKQLLRLIVLAICICISCYQLIGCFNKIKNPPISTHYQFELNQSIKYPAITICRNPPFKIDLFKKYGLTSKEILTSTSWKSFNFDNYTLQEFFEETTFDEKEIILMKAFDGSQQNMDISSSITLKYGRCFTYKPKKESINFGNNYGYSFMLYNNDTPSEAYSSPGFHINIIHRNAAFSERGHKGNAFNEYTYVEVGDNIAINLKINKFNQLSNSNSKCNSENNYTQSKCIQENTNKFITEAVGCSTPWVPNENVKLCNTYNQTKLIVDYSTESIYLEDFIKQCNCGIRCNLTTYTPFLQSVSVWPKPAAAFKIYISSNLYTLMEEVVGYDWNCFLADLGGSLGFLLGLSVLGMIGMAEQVINTIIKIKSSKKKSFNLNNSNDELNESKKPDIANFNNDGEFAKKINNEEKNLREPSSFSKY